MGFKDLREFIEAVDGLGELKRIDGAVKDGPIRENLIRGDDVDRHYQRSLG